jgi:WD40 repeat protein
VGDQHRARAVHFAGPYRWSLASSTLRRRSPRGERRFDGKLRLWWVSSGHLAATLQGHSGPVSGVALSADGEQVASGDTDGTVRLLHASTGHSLVVLKGHGSAVWGVALSADGRVVASGGTDARVRLWETSTGRSLATLEGHSGGVFRVALSGHGEVLASSGFDGTVPLWESATGACLRTLRAPRRYERGTSRGLLALPPHSARRCSPRAPVTPKVSPLRNLDERRRGAWVSSGRFAGTTVRSPILRGRAEASRRPSASAAGRQTNRHSPAIERTEEAVHMRREADRG